MTPSNPGHSAKGGSAGKQRLELLAPAGDELALTAALDAGASAVYLGLTTLNARRRAKNFSPEDFSRAVEDVHRHSRKAYLTLNTDLAEREVGQAARILELARQSGADAVLVRDPGLLALRPHFPELEFHFSTQSCMANSADVAAAGELGIHRVVLAREMTLGEIAAASAVPGVETEVFVQGALCFSVSGRCLLSSWVGGRSGNRGTCTSPCRVPWTIEDQPAHTPLSMCDLATAHRLDDLARAGVTALKIEGRLKTADWVSRAVRLYRRGLDGDAAPEELFREAAELGAYTGRAMTCGYLDGDRDTLIGVAEGRMAETPAAEEETENDTPEPATEDAEDLASEASEPGGQAKHRGPAYDFEMNVEPRGIVCRCRCGNRADEWSIPKTVVRRANKAAAIGDVLHYLSSVSIQGFSAGRTETNAPEFLLVPRAVNALVARISSTLRLAQRSPDGLVRIELPAAVQAALEKDEPAKANRLTLGDPPDRARLNAAAVSTFVKNAQPGGVIVEGLTAGRLGKALAACGDRVSLVAALPAVLFEDDLPAMRQLVAECARAGVPVEVNSWGGWRLARQAAARMESGPGLSVLNSLAARMLAGAGVQCVTLSMEADRRQWEDAAAHCPAPCSLIVYGRPPLLTTRVRLPDESAGRVFGDRRDVRMTPRRERGLWVFRPVEPFDLRATVNPRIRVAHLVVDLVGCDDPVGAWYDQPGERAFRFNYDRALA